MNKTIAEWLLQALSKVAMESYDSIALAVSVVQSILKTVLELDLAMDILTAVNLQDPIEVVKPAVFNWMGNPNPMFSTKAMLFANRNGLRYDSSNPIMSATTNPTIVKAQNVDAVGSSRSAFFTLKPKETESGAREGPASGTAAGPPSNSSFFKPLVTYGHARYQSTTTSTPDYPISSLPPSGYLADSTSEHSFSGKHVAKEWLPTTDRVPGIGERSLGDVIGGDRTVGAERGSSVLRPQLDETTKRNLRLIVTNFPAGISVEDVLDLHWQLFKQTLDLPLQGIEAEIIGFGADIVGENSSGQRLLAMPSPKLSR